MTSMQMKICHDMGELCSSGQEQAAGHVMSGSMRGWAWWEGHPEEAAAADGGGRVTTLDQLRVVVDRHEARAALHLWAAAGAATEFLA